MSEKQTPQWTLEQVEAHLQKANLDQFNQPRAAAVASTQENIGDILEKVCGVYRGIKPILDILKNFPFIPASIKKALTTFMSVLDSICPAK